MRKQVLWRSMLGLRAAAALLMIGGFLAAGARSASAQGEDSTIDGNTYEGFNFEWSIEWDEDVWTDASDDNTGGSDFLSLSTTDDEPLAFATFLGASAYGGDPDECLDNYSADLLESNDNNSDVAEADDVDLPRVSRDQANGAFTYTFDTDDGPVDLIDYVVCQTLVEDDAVLIASVSTQPDDFDASVENFSDLLDEVVIGGGSSADDGDEDEDVTPEADDDGEDEGEDVTPETDDEDEGDEEDAEPTRDVLLGDDDEGDEDEDVTPEADDEDTEPVAGSGIDRDSYESPTYGYTVEWDDSLWVASEDDELIDDGSVGMDRLLIEHFEDGDPDGTLFSDLYVEGKEDYAGDPADCVEGEADLLSSSDSVTDFAPLEDSSGDPIEGESDAGGEFAAFTATIDNGEDDPFELGYYIECQTLVEDESVVVITLVTVPDSVEDELEVAQDVIDTLDIPGGGSSASDDSADDDSSSTNADDEADAEATEEDE